MVMENNLEFLVHLYQLIIFTSPDNDFNLLKKCWESGDKEAATQTYKKHKQKKLSQTPTNPSI